MAKIKHSRCQKVLRRVICFVSREEQDCAHRDSMRMGDGPGVPCRGQLTHCHALGCLCQKLPAPDALPGLVIPTREATPQPPVPQDGHRPVLVLAALKIDMQSIELSSKLVFSAVLIKS